MASLHPGDVLDNRYRIEMPIARGGMSTVYLCIDTRLDRPVAAKVLDDAYASDPVFRQRFRREARSLARLKHSCLVDVYDTSADGEHVFIIMELITGGTLRELLAERGPMPPHAAAAVMRSVLTGLSIAHDAGMIHRDIKPDNVLINSNHEVKLADFGLVRGTQRPGGVEETIMGTAAYLAPEQVRGVPLTQACDVYAAGVVLYELLTGLTPFRGGSTQEVAYARLEADVPPPSEAIEGVPYEFDELVRHATARDVDNRYSDAHEFLDALDEAAAALGLPDFKVPVPHNAAAHRAADQVTEFTDLITSAIPQAPAPTQRDDDGTLVFEGVDVHPQPLEETSVLDSAVPVNPAVPAPVINPQMPEPDETAVWPGQQEQWPGAPQPVNVPVPQQSVDGQVQSADAPQISPVTNRGAGRVVAWLVVVTILLSIIALGGWWLGSGRYGEIPVVGGSTPSVATASISNAGFAVTTTEKYSDDVAAGEVIGTVPGAGERLPKGRTVELLVSLGQPTVPELATRAQESYRQLIEQHQLVWQAGEPQFSDDVPEGQIVDTEPTPGTRVGVGSTVVVHLSKGPAPVAVPAISDVEADKARSILERAGLKVNQVQEQFADGIAAGRVIDTVPPAGTQLTRGQSVDLLVSNALTVPKVAGKTVEQATYILSDAGLVVGEVTVTAGEKPAKSNAVVKTFPEAGAFVDPAFPSVDLVVPEKVAVPNLVGKKVSDATAALEAAGLKVEQTGLKPSARVVATSPKAGSGVKPGTAVSLKTL